MGREGKLVRLYTGGLIWLALLTSSVSADQLCPKYGECVPRAAFDCGEFDRSSLVTRVCYNSSKAYLIIRLKQTDYHYCEIPPDTVAALEAAESMGRYYNAEIKGRFDCRDRAVPTFP